MSHHHTLHEVTIERSEYERLQARANTTRWQFFVAGLINAPISIAVWELIHG